MDLSSFTSSETGRIGSFRKSRAKLRDSSLAKNNIRTARKLHLSKSNFKPRGRTKESLASGGSLLDVRHRASYKNAPGKAQRTTSHTAHRARGTAEACKSVSEPNEQRWSDIVGIFPVPPGYAVKSRHSRRRACVDPLKVICLSDAENESGSESDSFVLYGSMRNGQENTIGAELFIHDLLRMPWTHSEFVMSPGSWVLHNHTPEIEILVF